MRSMRDPGDLTARARIRDAAIGLIGTHGFDRASMRLIAQAAGVSPGLVVHHFGDKNGLRAACNDHVAALFAPEREGGEGVLPTIESIQAAMSDLDTYGPALSYLAVMLSDDDSHSADELFDGILQGTIRNLREQEQAGVIQQQSDLRGTALLLTLFGLAPIVLSRQFARSVGEDALTPAAVAKITVPLMELLTHGLYADDSILEATRSAMEER